MITGLELGTTVQRIVDRTLWNRLVQGFAAADFKQGWEWGEIRNAGGWAPTRFAAFQDGACVAAFVCRMPVVTTRSCPCSSHSSHASSMRERRSATANTASWRMRLGTAPE